MLSTLSKLQTGANALAANPATMHTTVAPMAWNEALRVSHPAMDAEHAHFIALVCAAQQADDAALPAAFDALLEHAQTHFAAENALMVDTDFPSRDCHQQEHDAVLATLRGVRQRLARGEHGVARAVVAELAAWLPPHVLNLDAALSHWISRHRYGGAPIVLRRRAAEAALA